jgi:aspartate oxidase
MPKLVETTKRKGRVMSRTPICDRWEYESYSSGLVVPLNVAKELESELANKDRQLTEAQAEIENLKWHINSEKAKAEAVLELNSKALKLVNEARAEIERKDKLIEQMREALKAIDGIGREAGNARREDALRCFAIAAAALASEGARNEQSH